MPLADLAGAVFGPFLYRTSIEKVMEYVAATGDDPDRWSESAPPTLAGALLFEVAPKLLALPDVAGASVVHGDQSFTWERAILMERDLAVTGTVARARERNGVFFVGFDLTVTDDDQPVLVGSSSFLISSPGGAVVEVRPEEDEPEPQAGSEQTIHDSVEYRSASRADLVRYAGASRDWNPIHWDHASAVDAGLGGVVVHGLLQSAWLTVAASRLVPGSQPFTSAKFRYRSPLRPAQRAVVSLEGADRSRIRATLATGDTVYVTGVFDAHE